MSKQQASDPKELVRELRRRGKPALANRLFAANNGFKTLDDLRPRDQAIAVDKIDLTGIDFTPEEISREVDLMMDYLP